MKSGLFPCLRGESHVVVIGISIVRNATRSIARGRFVSSSIKAIVDRENYETIGEKNYISSSALRYRLNKIYADAGVNNRAEFEELIHTHLGEENPFAFIENC